MVRSEMSLWILLQLVVLLLAAISTGRAGASECPKPVLEGALVLSDEAILKNDFPDGSDVTLECANGFVVDHGSDRITCTAGKWSEPNLICKKKDCGPPKPVPNLHYTILDGTLFGAYIQVNCDEKYYLEGSSHRQCLATGWSGRAKCVLITCEAPPSIPNGVIETVKEQVEFGDIIQYFCDLGYTLKGNRSISCQEDGTYSQPPECVAIECQAPEIQFGVQIKGESHYTYKSEAVFQCHPGYTMKGSPSAVCEEDGWSELPVCIQAIECQDPEIQFGVQIKGESPYTYKSEAIFQCHPGYTMKGSPSAVCEEDGWSELPVCIQEIPTKESDLRTTDDTTISITNSASTAQPDLLDPGYHLGTEVLVSILVCVILTFIIVCTVLVFGLYRYSRRKGMGNRTAPAF